MFQGRDKRSNDRYAPDKVEQGFRILRARMAQLEVQSKSNKLASKSSPVPPTKKYKETDADVYNRIHTKCAPWALAIGQIAAAALIRLSSASLWRDEAAAEGATWLILNICAFTLPAIIMLFVYPERISRNIKLSIACVFLFTFGGVALMEWLGF
jgi:hypothetical protein